MVSIVLPVSNRYPSLILSWNKHSARQRQLLIIPRAQVSLCQHTEIQQWQYVRIWDRLELVPNGDDLDRLIWGVDDLLPCEDSCFWVLVRRRDLGWEGVRKKLDKPDSKSVPRRAAL